MIKSEIQIRPRYSEVDQMGYVYHGNYVSYCHQARTELLREFELNDSVLEDQNIMMPVISFDIKYKKPARYDELLTIKVLIKEMPKVRFNFEFEVWNDKGALITTANSTIVFVDKTTRLPIIAPEFVIERLSKVFEKQKVEY